MDAQSNQNTSKLEPFHRVLRRDVPGLAKSLEAHGSEALCVHSVIMTMLDWWEKNEDYGCTILAPEGGEHNGVCVIIMEEYERKRLIVFAPKDETPRFLKCLEETNLIPWDSVTTVARLIKRLSEPVCRLVEAKGYKLHNRGAWNYVVLMSPSDALALEEPKMPKDVSLRDLTENDAYTIAKNWKFVNSDALPFTRDGIKYNGGVGAVDKDGELIGQFYVLPSHRRLGLGRFLAMRLAKKIAEKGRIVTGDIECDNEASLKLSQSLGFHCDHLNCYLRISRDK